MVDRALERHGAGETFVYGIHQEMDPAVRSALERRYREAGWAEAKVREGATGAWLLVLIP